MTHSPLLTPEKDEAFGVYIDYEAWVDTQLSAKIKILHSDRGGEYIGKYIVAHLKSKGTITKLTVHDTPHTTELLSGEIKPLSSEYGHYSMLAGCHGPCGEKRRVMSSG